MAELTGQSSFNRHPAAPLF